MRRRPFAVVAAVCLSSVVLFTVWDFISLAPWSRGGERRSNVFEGSTKAPYEYHAQDKAIVIAKMATDNVDWVADNLSDWQHAIYHMDDQSHVLHVPENKGREAQAYLTFLVDHYDHLPELMLFLHPHLEGWPAAWHTDAEDYNNVISVNGLRLDYVREHGYVNMRCIHTPGCPDEIRPFRNSSDPDRAHEAAFKDAWMYLFQTDLSTVPETIGTPCCSQFAVSRDQVLKRPRSDYSRYRRWLLDTELESDVSGRVLEYMWHVIFGKEPVWCPELLQCWCEQFGRC